MQFIIKDVPQLKLRCTHLEKVSHLQLCWICGFPLTHYYKLDHLLAFPQSFQPHLTVFLSGWRLLSCHDVTRCHVTSPWHTTTCYKLTCWGCVTTTELHLLRKTTQYGWKLWKKSLIGPWVLFCLLVFLLFHSQHYQNSHFSGSDSQSYLWSGKTTFKSRVN